MGLFGGSKTDNTSQFERYLIEGEVIEAVYRLVLDEICFTNKRIIFIDKEALSTKKQLISLPYHSIYYFGVEKVEFSNLITKLNYTLKEHIFLLNLVEEQIF